MKKKFKSVLRVGQRIPVPDQNTKTIDEEVESEDEDESEASAEVTDEEKQLEQQIQQIKRKNKPREKKPLDIPYVSARMAARLAVERPWIIDIGNTFRARGHTVDEYHEDFRVDIQETVAGKGWRICVIELLGETFNLSIYFDYSTNYAMRKCASMEYIEPDSLVAGVEYLLDVMKKFSNKTGKLSKNSVKPLDFTIQEEDDEPTAEEE